MEIVSNFPSAECQFIFGLRRGLTDLYREKLESLQNMDIFASSFNRGTINLNALPSYQKERVYSVLDKWPEHYKTDILSYPISLIIVELQRDSIYKREAYKLGLIRPFLLYVSMDPELRLQWAHSFGINLINKTYLGDSHRESFKMVCSDRKGLQARATYAFSEKLAGSNGCNWYQIIYRVTRTALKKAPNINDEIIKQKFLDELISLNCCLDSENKEVLQMEELFLYGIFETVIEMRKELGEDKLKIIEETPITPDIEEVIEKLKESGFKNDKHLHIIALHAMGKCNITSLLFETLENWLEAKKEGRSKSRMKVAIPFTLLGAQVTLFAAFALISPLIVLPMTMLAANSLLYIYRDTPGKLLGPLIGLCIQRAVLAANGIKVRNYYPKRDVVNEDSSHSLHLPCMSVYVESSFK